MSAKATTEPGWLPATAEELTDDWACVRWDDGRRSKEFTGPIARAVMTVAFVVAGVLAGDLLAPLLPIACIVGAVYFAVIGEWLWALGLLVAAPFMVLLVRESLGREVMVRRDAVRVRTTLRTVTVPWSSVVFSAEQAKVLGTERMVLVIAGGDRVVHFRGDGPFVLQASTLPALAAQLNRVAAATGEGGR